MRCTSICASSGHRSISRSPRGRTRSAEPASAMRTARRAPPLRLSSPAPPPLLGQRRRRTNASPRPRRDTKRSEKERCLGFPIDPSRWCPSNRCPTASSSWKSICRICSTFGCTATITRRSTFWRCPSCRLSRALVRWAKRVRL